MNRRRKLLMMMSGGKDFILPNRFVLKVKTDNAGTSDNNQFTLTGAESVDDAEIPVTYSPVSDPFDYTDVTLNVSDPTITFPSEGEFYVQYGSPLNRVQFGDGGDRLKVTSAPLQWGNIAWSNMSGAFFGCANMGAEKSKDVPNLSSVDRVNSIFRSCTNFNQDISVWDVSNVTSFARSFQGSPAFNADIGGWSVKNSISMNNMFDGATSFNHSLENWELRLAGVNLAAMLNNCGMNTVNYSRTLIGLANYVHANEGTPSGLTLGASGMTYDNTVYTGIGSGHFTDAVSARDYLTTTATATITGDSNVS